MTFRILRSAVVLTIAAASAFGAAAGFVIHDVKGQVTILKGNSSRAAVKGTAVLPSEQVDIPDGCSISIRNDVNGIIYTSTDTGRMHISRMMIHAKEASGNTRTVGRETRLGKNSGDSRVYVEKGMVKRSLSDYDPEASGLEIAPDVLAAAITRAVGGESMRPSLSPGVEIRPLAEADSSGHGFELINNSEYPVYFNVLRVIKAPTSEAAISRLGQPSGCYVVLPHQTMRRCDSAMTPNPDELQMLVATGCQFDVDGLCEALGHLLKIPAPADGPVLDLPISIVCL